MENNTAPDESGRAAASTDILDVLRADRARLADGIRIPRWVAPAFGLIAAAYVSIPMLPGENSNTFVIIVGLVASVCLEQALKKRLGFTYTRVGARQWAILASSLGVTLALLCVSLGLRAGNLTEWIPLSVVVAFVSVTVISRAFYASLRERMRRVG